MYDSRLTSGIYQATIATIRSITAFWSMLSTRNLIFFILNSFLVSGLK